MRSRTEKDPHHYYEVIKVLGEGSMGSVSKVQKWKSVVGGSARSSYVEEEKRRSQWWCPGVRMPCFTFCPVLTVEKSKNSLLQTIEEHSPASETLLPLPTTKALSESSNGSSSSSIITYGRRDVIYALKSIHIDRVKDAVFRKELMNEIAILQTLDHPNIVKAIVG
jgi:serine/threonine protein kinase